MVHVQIVLLDRRYHPVQPLFSTSNLSTMPLSLYPSLSHLLSSVVTPSVFPLISSHLISRLGRRSLHTSSKWNPNPSIHSKGGKRAQRKNLSLDPLASDINIQPDPANRFGMFDMTGHMTVTGCCYFFCRSSLNKRGSLKMNWHKDETRDSSAVVSFLFWNGSNQEGNGKRDSLVSFFCFFSFLFFSFMISFECELFAAQNHLQFRSLCLGDFVGFVWILDVYLSVEKLLLISVTDGVSSSDHYHCYPRMIPLSSDQQTIINK